MSFFRSMATPIYNWVTGFLPWGYMDTVNDTAISVEKAEGGLRVTTTQGSHLKLTPITVVVIPQAEIERLLSR